ncbi:MAG: peptidoglycan editing factor PgeF [Aquificaceae bacterium]|nr:peptidoglycan editing factor PgeF [Aquificaceae bacterium]
MREENLRKGKEAGLMFSLVRGRTRVVIKRWEEDADVVTLRQVHSSEVHVLEDPLYGVEGDAIITYRRGLKVGVRTADCVPVALLGSKTVAVIHAGWRGLKSNIIEKTLEKLSLFEPLENFLAFVGPSAKACCYEVGEEFKEHFKSLQIKNQRHYMDTQEEALIRLKKEGIKHFFLYGVCTICHHAFPSYRKDKTEERMLTFAEIL